MGNCTHFTSPEPTFSTNGVPNPDQSGLDLEAGAGITLADAGKQVTISATAGPGPTFVDADPVVGTIDGVNRTFTLSFAPNPALSLELPLNGNLLTQGVDYTLSGATITTTSAPQVGDALGPAWYRT